MAPLGGTATAGNTVNLGAYGRPVRRRRRWLPGMAVVLVIAIGGALAYLVLSSSHPPKVGPAKPEALPGWVRGAGSPPPPTTAPPAAGAAGAGAQTPSTPPTTAAPRPAAPPTTAPPTTVAPAPTSGCQTAIDPSSGSCIVTDAPCPASLHGSSATGPGGTYVCGPTSYYSPTADSPGGPATWGWLPPSDFTKD